MFDVSHITAPKLPHELMICVIVIYLTRILGHNILYLFLKLAVLLERLLKFVLDKLPQLSVYSLWFNYLTSYIQSTTRNKNIDPLRESKR